MSSGVLEQIDDSLKQGMIEQRNARREKLRGLIQRAADDEPFDKRQLKLLPELLDHCGMDLERFRRWVDVEKQDRANRDWEAQNAAPDKVAEFEARRKRLGAELEEQRAKVRSLEIELQSMSSTAIVRQATESEINFHRRIHPLLFADADATAEEFRDAPLTMAEAATARNLPEFLLNGRGRPMAVPSR